MTDTKFFGVEITNTDDYGSICLRLTIDMLENMRCRKDDPTHIEQARLIAQVCCEDMLTALAVLHNWDTTDIEYAESVLEELVGTVANELHYVAENCIQSMSTSKNHPTNDLEAAAIMSSIMMIPRNVKINLENTFYNTHGAMNISR